MEFFQKGIELMEMIVTAIGAGLTVWGLINLFQSRIGDNPNAQSTGINFFIVGVGVMAVGALLIPELAKLISF